MKVFLSYASVDLDSFKIPEIVDLLESQPGVDKIYYFHRDCKDSIIKYIEKSIQISKYTIFMCSENSNRSDSFRQEVELVTIAHKNWIPVFRDFNDVPFILQTIKGIKFNDNDFQGFLKALYYKLTRLEYKPQISKKMKDIIPIYSESGKPLGTVLRKEIHEKPLWHKTSIIIVVHPNGKIIYSKRSEESLIDPNKFDSFGGHLIEKDNDNIRNSAKRELSEELNIPINSINDENFIQIGEENGIKDHIDFPHFNYEMSTAFVFFISKELITQENIIYQESFGEEDIQLNHFAVYLDQFIKKFNQDSDKFAFGITRILNRKNILKKISQLIQTRQKA
ncbi:MAG: TIR domain-containing protein [Promethearchaeota archaeon]|jgi:8-oxo-dGTP pyrophosphatase MutT (NUDIX family)